MKLIKTLILFLMILGVSAPSYAVGVTTYKDMNTFEKDFSADKGKKILFLFASWCSACKFTFPVLPKIAENTDYTIYALSLDKKQEAIENYVAKYEVKDAGHKGALKVLYFDDVPLKDIADKLKSMNLTSFKGSIPFTAIYDNDKIVQQGKIDVAEMYKDGKLP